MNAIAFPIRRGSRVMWLVVSMVLAAMHITLNGEAIMTFFPVEDVLRSVNMPPTKTL